MFYTYSYSFCVKITHARMIKIYGLNRVLTRESSIPLFNIKG